MLRLKEVNAWYGEAQALRDINLHIPPGASFALLGANGAGKSTLLRTICGITENRHGEIEFANQRIDTLAPEQIVERGLIMVPEGRSVFPFMTVEENLLLGSYARRARPRRAETLKRVYELLPRLAARRHQLGGSMSGGEQQMCAIARGLMAQPELLILDEPSLGLAPIIVKEVFTLVRNLQDLGTSILLVEQHVKNALETSNYGAVLENGRVALTGSAQELLHDPQLRKAYMGHK